MEYLLFQFAEHVIVFFTGSEQYFNEALKIVNILICNVSKNAREMLLKIILFIKRLLCCISVIEILVFHHKDTLETKIKSLSLSKLEKYNYTSRKCYCNTK